MNSIRIGDRLVGPDAAPFIMLEAGINHNGDLALATKMIRAAKQAGADAIKFQTFKAEEFVSDKNLTFTYSSQGKEVTESMLEMFRRYEFSREQWFEVKRVCDEENMLFLSTPQNPSDLDLLLELGVPAVKVGSDDFTNLPLLKRYTQCGLPLLISCGMADLAEVYDALEATGALSGYPIILMLCTSQYPTPPNDANLLKLRTLAGAFPHITLGFSDHTQGHLAATLACGLGACAFEKHFTLDNNLPGPDHWFSETPEGATQWIHAIRTARQLLGNPLVQPTPAEKNMRRLARRSITALQNISAGELFTDSNIGLRRPGDGLPPKFFDFALGKKSRHTIEKGQQLTLGDIS
jgi:N,N'-diacetyllegionaminate synthase